MTSGRLVIVQNGQSQTYEHPEHLHDQHQLEQLQHELHAGELHVVQSPSTSEVKQQER